MLCWGLIVAATTIEGIEDFATFAAMIERSGLENMLTKLRNIKHKIGGRREISVIPKVKRLNYIRSVLWMFMVLVYPNYIRSNQGCCCGFRETEEG
jgi:hypothetical protein